MWLNWVVSNCLFCQWYCFKHWISNVSSFLMFLVEPLDMCIKTFQTFLVFWLPLQAWLLLHQSGYLWRCSEEWVRLCVGLHPPKHKLLDYSAGLQTSSSAGMWWTQPELIHKRQVLQFSFTNSTQGQQRRFSWWTVILPFIRMAPLLPSHLQCLSDWISLSKWV